MNQVAGSVVAEELTIAPLTFDPDDIARFIDSVYDSYPHGKSFVPRWSGRFLKHIIFDHPDFTPDHALGAFLGDRLVGVMLAQPHSVHFRGERLQGVFGSWLAITKEAAAQFGAVKLISELKERMAARGGQFMLGIAYRSGPGVGLDFWESFMRAFPKDISQGRDLTFWARVLDGSALARAVSDPLLKIGGHSARLRPVFEPRVDQHIRAYAASDLERCQRLFDGLDVDMCTAPGAWELQSALDLETGPQTLVLDRGEGVEGVSMFHILPMSDAGPLKVGMIDHLTVSKGVKDLAGVQGRLLAATLWRLKQAGACLALVPKKPDIAGARMMLRGFVPYSADFKIFMMPYGNRLEAEMPASFDLLVR